MALLCATLLFLAPVSWRKRRFALSWADGQRVNWGVLMLFGGGLSLGTLGEATGIAKWAGEGVVSSGLATSPESFMLVAVIAAVTVSEFASNTASATLLVPIVIAAARAGRLRPGAARARRRPRRDLRLHLPGLDPAERHRLRHRPRARSPA